MSIPKSRRGLLNHFNRASAEIRNYFQYLPKLLADFPLDVCLAYLFARLELAQNMTLYCGVVKLHHANAAVARSATDTHRMTRGDFRDKFQTVFGKQIPDKITDALETAEDVRDRVMHGKSTREKDKRNAIAKVIDYAEALNTFVDSIASFSPFGDLRGFKGRARSLDKSTTRWLLKGMGFSLS